MALMAAGAADAGAAGCRRVPVYTATCFSQEKPSARCRPIAYPAATCFTVHGVLFASNGAPAFRLWRSGTRRILGVLGGGGEPDSPTVLPESLRAQMLPRAPGPLNSVVGDFRVCPLATERAGWMQPVCIESAAHVAPTRRHYGA
ncbi:MAG: hypothetical protein ACHP7N_10855 [Caulobacterales bacterium]